MELLTVPGFSVAPARDLGPAGRGPDPVEVLLDRVSRRHVQLLKVDSAVADLLARHLDDVRTLSADHGITWNATVAYSRGLTDWMALLGGEPFWNRGAS